MTKEQENVINELQRMKMDKSHTGSDHKCHTCKHYTSGEYDGSCGSYICKNYSDWEKRIEE